MPATITEPSVAHAIKRIKWAWTSDSGGAVTSQTANAYSGAVVRFAAVPSGGGTQPTNAYDVTITDEDGLDVLNGTGADLSNAATVYKGQNDGLGWMKQSKLQLNITNAGNAKTGTIYLFILIANTEA